MPCSDFFPLLEFSPGARLSKGLSKGDHSLHGGCNEEIRVMMLFLALFAAMAMPVAGIGPVQTQACGTDKPPPPPG
jgi:hypothetical protein